MDLFRVKMKALAAGPKGTLQPGKTYPLSWKIARGFVDGGYADPVDPIPESEPLDPAAEPETAAIATPETAVAKRPKKGRRK